MAGLNALNAAAQPANVPPVPAKSQNASICPPDWRMNSGPVPRKCARKLPSQPELVGAKRAAFDDDVLCRLLHQRQVAARYLAGHGAGELIHQHDLRAEGAHHARPFHRVTARHDRHEWVALDRADDGKAGTGVAAGQLDDRLAGTQQAVRLGVLDHLAGDAVLFGEAGVEVIQFGEDAAFDAARQAR